jgi:hypothetical protein
MLGVFAEFETNLQRERQLEGIAKAKVAGVYNGRKPSIDVAKIEALKASGLGPTEIVRKLKIGRASVYRVVARRTPKGKPRRLGRTGFSHYRTAGDRGGPVAVQAHWSPATLTRFNLRSIGTPQPRLTGKARAADRERARNRAMDLAPTIQELQSTMWWCAQKSMRARCHAGSGNRWHHEPRCSRPAGPIEAGRRCVHRFLQLHPLGLLPDAAGGAARSPRASKRRRVTGYE